MATRTSANWESTPGSFDTVRADITFESDNPLGIPKIYDDGGITLPSRLVQFNGGDSVAETYENAGLHFFVDDYRFERVWNRPFKTLSVMQRFPMVLTPDFSLYRDWPRVVQIWNIYRSRWLGAFWQSEGVRVVPTVSWADPLSYAFCFLGLPKRGTVALSTQCLFNDREAHRLFYLGIEAMIMAIEPRCILVYGEDTNPLTQFMLKDLQRVYDSVEDVRFYPSRWDALRSQVADPEKEARKARKLLMEKTNLVLPPGKTRILKTTK